jgi:hypothetical protein
MAVSGSILGGTTLNDLVDVLVRTSWFGGTAQISTGFVERYREPVRVSLGREGLPGEDIWDIQLQYRILLPTR